MYFYIFFSFYKTWTFFTRTDRIKVSFFSIGAWSVRYVLYGTYPVFYFNVFFVCVPPQVFINLRPHLWPTAATQGLVVGWHMGGAGVEWLYLGRLKSLFQGVARRPPTGPIMLLCVYHTLSACTQFSRSTLHIRRELAFLSPLAFSIIIVV